jgi:hypothetical protein
MAVSILAGLAIKQLVGHAVVTYYLSALSFWRDYKRGSGEQKEVGIRRSERHNRPPDPPINVQ